MADQTMEVKSVGSENGAEREEINISVKGKATITIAKTDEGYTISVFRDSDLEEIATTYFFDDDIEDEDE